MSRSRKFPMWTISKKIGKKAHRRVRKFVRQKLHALNLSDIDGPDLVDIEADTRSLGIEDYGTKFGWDPAEILDDEDAEDRERASRK